MRKEDDPSLSLLPSPGHAAAEPGTSLDAGQDSAPGSGLDARYEQLRHAALHARAEAFPLGLGALTRGGVTAWRHALASLAPAGQEPAGQGPAGQGPAGQGPAGQGTAAPARQPPGTRPAPPAGLPAPVAAELISALAAVALAGTITGPPP
jgi:hypothetical protein